MVYQRSVDSDGIQKAMWGADTHTEDSGVDMRSFKSKKARMDLI